MPRTITIMLSLLIAVTIPLQFETSLCQTATMMVLSNVELIGVGAGEISISWTTNLPSDSSIEWGVSDELGSDLTVEEETLFHHIVLEGLEPGSRYFLRVGSGGRWSSIMEQETMDPPEGRELIKFIIAGDSHLDVDGRNQLSGLMTGDSVELMGSFVNEINGMDDVEFTIFLGDNTNGDMDDYTGFSNAVDGLDVPWHFVFGNWDKQSDGWRDMARDILGLERTYYSFDSYGFHFVVLDSAVNGQVEGSLDDIQLDWLEKDLDDNEGAPTLIFLHHPVQESGVFTLDGESKDEFISIVDSRGWVLSVTGGHNHANQNVQGSGYCELISVSAISQYPVGYSIVTLFDNGYMQSSAKLKSELKTSEESRKLVEISSGDTDGDIDLFGDIDDRSFVISVEDHPPTITEFRSSRDMIGPGEMVELFLEVMDPDNDRIDIEITANNGDISSNDDRYFWTSPGDQGEHIITARATSNDLSDERSIIVEVKGGQEVNGNSRPMIERIQSSRTDIGPGDRITLTAVAEDPDGDPIEYIWNFDVGIMNGQGSSITWTAPDEEGDHRISLTVSDGFLISESSEITIRVRKDIPEVQEGTDDSGYSSLFILIGFLFLPILFLLRRNKSRGT